MKAMLVCVLLGVTMLGMTRAHGGGGDFGGFFGSSSEDSDSARFCTCATTFRRNNQCFRNIGARVFGCQGTNQFLQCTDAACAVQACPTGQVWNKTQIACAVCPAGTHVSADLQRCVCDQGTTPNRATLGCGPCPSGATIGADSCFCPVTTALDRTTNQCRACPTGSRLFRGDCSCTATAAPFFQESTWTCLACPGEWLPKPSSRNRNPGRQECTCTGTNQIFDRSAVVCYTCPASTTADRDRCLCPIRGQYFNMQTQVCACNAKSQLNAAKNACERIPVTTPTTPAAGNP